MARWKGWALVGLLAVLGGWGLSQTSWGQAGGQRPREGMRGAMQVFGLDVTRLRLMGQGGANQVLKQATPGGPVTVGSLASTELSDAANLARATGPQIFDKTDIAPRDTPLTGTGPFTINTNNTGMAYHTAVTANLTFTDPTGVPKNGQILRIRLTDAGPGGHTITWGPAWKDGASGFGITKPTATTGSGQTDLFLWIYDLQSATWKFLATSQALHLVGSVQLVPMNASLPNASGSGQDGEQAAEINNATTNQRLQFDTTTRECAFWEFSIPRGYVSTPKMEITYALLSPVVTGSVAWDISLLVDNGTTAFASLTYTASAACDDSAVPSTAGATHQLICPITAPAAMAAGRAAKLKLCRAVARDTAATDAVYHRGLFTYEQ